MVKIILALIMVFTLASTVNATTYNAATCSATDVNTAIALTSPGDTVSVPSGTCTWSTQVSMSNKKGIKLQGAGIGVTNINLPMDAALSLGSSSSLDTGAYEITGFTFTDTANDWVATIRITNVQWATVRIHDNKFNGGKEYNISTDSSHLLIDHNQFYGGNEFFLFTNQSVGQVTEAKKPIGWGKNFGDTSAEGIPVDWVFVEDNYIYQPCGQVTAICDAKYAGKAVFRHNTIVNGYVLAHGACWSYPAEIDGWAYEVYNNTFVVTDGCNEGVGGHATQVMDWMGGALQFHDNTVQWWGSGYDSANYWQKTSTNAAPFLWQDARTIENPALGGSGRCAGNMWQYCDGTPDRWCSGSTAENWYTCNNTNSSCTDGNGANHGTCNTYHCSNSWTLCTNDSQCGGGTCTGTLDQQGTGTGHVCFNGTGAGRLLPNGTIDLDPVYWWNNIQQHCNADGTGCTTERTFTPSISTSGSIDVNFTYGIDIYNGTAKPGYTAFTYPHPLVSTGPYTITASIGNVHGSPAGTIDGVTSPVSKIVSAGSTTSFYAASNTGSHIYSVGGNCGSTVLTPGVNTLTYTTDPVNSNCSVVATFGQYIQTSEDSGGHLACPAMAINGESVTCTWSPIGSYHLSTVSGCGTSWVYGNTVTTGNLVADCQITVTSAANTWLVTPSGGSNGTVLPNSSRLAANNEMVGFVITPSPGYYPSITTTCAGYASYANNVYKFGPVTGNCSFQATFLPYSTQGTHGGISATGGKLSVSGGKLGAN